MALPMMTLIDMDSLLNRRPEFSPVKPGAIKRGVIYAVS